MTDLLKYRIPADFVLARLIPTPDELAYGFHHNWIADTDAITLALAMYGTGNAPPPIENLAMLLSDEASRASELIDQITSDPTEPDTARAWLFLALAWLHENTSNFLDPYEAIEMLYADFDYPSSIEGFVRFMPPPVNGPVGMSSLDTRWEEYLASEAIWFSTRHDDSHDDYQ